MPPVEGIRLEGLRELTLGFQHVSKDVSKKFRAELREVGEGVRALAESKAESDIPHIGATWARGSFGGAGAPWARMRLGVTSSMVYIVPRSRRRGGSPRPNLAGLLLNRAMTPAADELREATVVKVEGMLERITAENGFLSF